MLYNCQPLQSTLAVNNPNEDVFAADTNSTAPGPYHEFYQGMTPEAPTAAPPAFVLKGRVNLRTPASHQEDGRASPTPRAPSIIEHSDDDNDLDSEIVAPEEDELCVQEAGDFGGDGYPRPAPPKTFVKKMEELGRKQFLAVAPDVTSAKAALTDIELVL